MTFKGKLSTVLAIRKHRVMNSYKCFSPYFFTSLLNSSIKIEHVLMSQLSLIVGCLSQSVTYQCKSTMINTVFLDTSTVFIQQPFLGKKLFLPRCLSTKACSLFKPSGPSVYQLWFPEMNIDLLL